jgi:hypothetical protein
VSLAQVVSRPVPSTLPYGAIEGGGAVSTPIQQVVNAPSTQQSAMWVLVACGVFMLAAVVFIAVLMWYRRRNEDDEPSSAEPWTLDDLRQLRASGSLTEEEYQRVRAAMIATYRGRDAGGGKPRSSPEKAD